MYKKYITHQHRTAFIMAIDCSASMQELITFNNMLMSKAEAVALACNYLIDELMARATRHDRVRDYYDIAVLGYFDSSVVSLLPCNDLISISHLAEHSPEPRDYSFMQRIDCSRTTTAHFTLHPWISALAQGTTPMYEALIHIDELVGRWCSRPENRDSFPPMIFNITDGECSDGNEMDLISVAERIRSHRTSDGEALLFNIHLGTNDEEPRMLFPSDYEPQTCDSRRLLLMRMSSLLPESMEQYVDELINPSTPAPYRCAAFNASIHILTMILNIGSQSINNA